MSSGQPRDVFPIIMTLIYKFLQIYNLSTFIITMLDAFYQSLICFFVPYLVSIRVINILIFLSSLKKTDKFTSELSRFITVYLLFF